MAQQPRGHDHLAGRLNEWTFHDVLVAARHGDGVAFAELWRRHAGQVAAFIRARGAEEPDEVVNDAFASVFSRLGTFRGDEHDFRALVFTVARRRLVDERRRSGRRPLTRPWDPGSDDAARGSRADVHADIHPADDELRWLLRRLTDEQREVIVLRVVADLGVARIAEITGRREGAVKALQRRALKVLRDQLDAHEHEGVTDDSRR